MKIQTRNVIDSHEWDRGVKKTYGRPYNLQQQDGCQSRGNIYLTVPGPLEVDEYPDEIPEVVNSPQMGVSFKAWLARDPKQPLPDRDEPWALDMWWARNFYPHLQMVANDLHAKGLLEAGEYTIDIDW